MRRGFRVRRGGDGGGLLALLVGGQRRNHVAQSEEPLVDAHSLPEGAALREGSLHPLAPCQVHKIDLGPQPLNASLLTFALRLRRHISTRRLGLSGGLNAYGEDGVGSARLLVHSSPRRRPELHSLLEESSHVGLGRDLGLRAAHEMDLAVRRLADLNLPGVRRDPPRSGTPPAAPLPLELLRFIGRNRSIPHRVLRLGQQVPYLLVVDLHVAHPYADFLVL